ncbi:alpha-actinin [Coemansia sp. RSA 1646]|nr:alpha-actinin [Coemansia sp. RSA 1646]KAJ1772130.1 alpha-actinin [Coemansia sp. RSA 1843]KAJ2091751.1 alpha-actinin [Coemansia sp. RSA 986]
MPGGHTRTSMPPKPAVDKSWELVQSKTFTKWVNARLSEHSLASLNNVCTDFSDGTALIHLLQIISDTSLGRYNRNPRMRIQKIENVNLSLDFIRSRKINLTNIGAEDIVDSNHKLILGMIWTIILRFTIEDINEEGLSAMDGLLLWCQRKTAPYKEVDVKNFSYSWQDGLAFCALIHRHRPDLLDYYALDKRDARGNTALAFEVAERYLGIPQLLDVEDVCDATKPDERSVMTYVAQYFHAFSSLSRAETAGRRLGKFTDVMQSVFDMQHDYEVRVAKLISRIDDQQSKWRTAKFEPVYSSARTHSTTFNSYKATTKREWTHEKVELDTLLGNIQTKRVTYNLAPFVPRAGLTPKDLEFAWNELAAAEVKHRKTINQYIRESRDVLQRQYGSEANGIQGVLNSISNSLAMLGGELDDQLATVNGLINKARPLEGSLQRLGDLEKQCEEANIDEHDYTVYSVSDLEYDTEMMMKALDKKARFIENQSAVRNMTNLTPAQLEEFEATFRYFDRDDSNVLNDVEFRAALDSLGHSFTDDEFGALYDQLSCGSEYISFEVYIRFMVELTEDQTTPEQLLQSFRVIAGDKEYVTQEDLRLSELSPPSITYLARAMPKSELSDDGYDYLAYLRDVFQ